MRAFAVRVREVWVGLALFTTPAIAVHAQVAFQVKSGTTWTSDIELKALGPLSFRWRWDGAETPTGVAWQLATVTPTSTATTRGADVIASETGMRLPASSDIKGGYQEFTVTPAASWPATFYIRVRVNTGRTYAYSRWISVTVVQRTSVVANPSCTIQATKHVLTAAGQHLTQAMSPGEMVPRASWMLVKLRVRYENRLTTPVSYLRSLVFIVDNGARKIETWYLDEEKVVHNLSASATDTFEHRYDIRGSGALSLPSGIIRAEVRVKPVSGIASECSFVFEIT